MESDLAQKRRALGLANEIRSARSELKRRIANGATSVVEVLSAPPREAEGMSLWDLLRSQPGWGEARSGHFLSHAQGSLGDGTIHRESTVGSLADSERSALVDLLSGRARPAAYGDRFAGSSIGEADDASVNDPPTAQIRAGWNWESRDDVTFWDELVSVARRYETVSGELGELVAQRDHLIRALSQAGASRRAVASAASLTVGRVQQILTASTKP